MRLWSVQEIRVVKAYADLGAAGVAELLDRSPQSVRHIAAMKGIPLRDSGEDVEILTVEILEKIKDAPTLSVCPMCGKRFARMKATGMCRCCHLDQLLDLHQERLDEQIRQLKLDKARQDKRRLRVCEKCGRPFFPRPSSKEILCGDCL